jgi:hypothetical protein
MASRRSSDHDAPPSPPGLPPDYGVEIIRAPVPASGSLSLDRAVNVAASAFPGKEWSPVIRSPTKGNPPKSQSSPFWEIRGRSASWRSARPPTFSRVRQYSRQLRS